MIADKLHLWAGCPRGGARSGQDRGLGGYAQLRPAPGEAALPSVEFRDLGKLPNPQPPA